MIYKFLYIQKMVVLDFWTINRYEASSIIVDLKHATCWWLTLTSVLINLLPPLQIGLPKGKDRLLPMNFQWLCLFQGVHYKLFGDSIEDVVKDQKSKTWLAKRKVIQVPHLAKLLANNNSVKVWIILDSQKTASVIQLKFVLQRIMEGGSKDHFEDEVLIFERTLWSTTPWCFVGKNQLLSENQLLSTPKKPNQCGVTELWWVFFSWWNCPKVCLLCPCFPSDSGERRGVGHLRHA